jgi:hypothetical protein
MPTDSCDDPVMTMTVLVVNERNFSEVLTEEMRAEYWRRVKRALTEIFGAASDLADAYRAKIEQAPVLGQMLAYRDEPLQIAADLAGGTVTGHEVSLYRDMFPHPIAARQPAMTLP